ncbi:MAG TPA: tRNA pseudouridine(55) synthase TruB [Thermoanaerobaculia bacterium]|nr:tRNA pseudouridine(55) synthase TruB [Thermoanaerobaculia bacterium]
MTAAQAPNDGPSGLLLVDKPEAITSHDVVDAVRRLLGTRRVGHTGTLDPAATGLLVLCVGRAGRLQSFLMSSDKSYEGTITFGVETNTYDREGTPVGTQHPDPRPDPDAVRAACSRYVGEIDQAPPPFSAKKIGGQRFYELARRGEAVPHLPKKVRITRFDTLSVEGDVARFHVDCSSGTYIRSLAHDVGKVLELGAHLSSLRRTRIGPFSLENARTLTALGELPVEGRTSLPSWIPLSEIPLPFPAVSLLPGEAAKVKRGHAVPVRVPPEAVGAPWIRLLCSGELVALGHLEPLGRGVLALVKPKIVLQD